MYTVKNQVKCSADEFSNNRTHRPSRWSSEWGLPDPEPTKIGSYWHAAQRGAAQWEEQGRPSPLIRTLVYVTVLVLPAFPPLVKIPMGLCAVSRADAAEHSVRHVSCSFQGLKKPLSRHGQYTVIGHA